MQVLETGYNKTCGNFNNLTRTTTLSVQKTFIDDYKLAEMQISSGAFSYNRATRDTKRELAAFDETVESTEDALW